MINLSEVFVSNGTAVIILLIILSASKKNLCRGFLDEKIYFSMVITTIIQCVFETITFCVDGKAGYIYRLILIVLSVIIYINDMVFSFSWTIFVDYKLFADMQRIKKKTIILALPGILVIIGCLINLATPVFFGVDQNNIYYRTSAYIVPYSLTYFYLAYGVIRAYIYQNKVNKYMFLPAMIFIIPISIGSLLQLFFYGYALVWLGVSVGLVAVFINFQNESSYIDSMTGLFNRQYFNERLSSVCKKESGTEMFAGIMVDIDNFKGINDSLGHSVGDDAISSAGRILRAAIGVSGEVFRYGGDEFVALMIIKNKNEVLTAIDNINSHLKYFNDSEKKPYIISFSIGYSIFGDKCESTDVFLKNMDLSMYENKKNKIKEKIIVDRRHHV